MNDLTQDTPGRDLLLMGNEAIARGALEAGVRFAAAYPGNPSSEIIAVLAKAASEADLYVEWSTNEKVALEAAAAASYSGLRALAAMKQNGLNVASDFLLNLNLTGTVGGLVVVVCDDPSGLSSTNEQDSRTLAKIADLPLLEPGDFQEAKDMIARAFEVSETLGLPCLVRSVTRISHARGNVRLGSILRPALEAHFDTSRQFIGLPPAIKHQALHARLEKARALFETSPFNRYAGPDAPELLLVASGACWLYALEARQLLGMEERVGILKLGTAWPLPEQWVLEHLARSEEVLFVEEVDPFLEDAVKALAAQHGPRLRVKRFYGQGDGTFSGTGEKTPDLVVGALERIKKVGYRYRPADYAARAAKAVAELAPVRQWGFCAGCPHRASYWAIKRALAMDDRDGFVLGDIGCYALGFGPSGFGQMKTMHAMGSGAGLATGMGQLARFGLKQPALAVCGDSTFYHAALPALVNAVYNRAAFRLVVLDNGATAMTGFQPHPGTGVSALGEVTGTVDMGAVCRAIGATVQVFDPFDLEAATQAVLDLVEEDVTEGTTRQAGGAKVLVFRQTCALVRVSRGATRVRMHVEEARCLGASCGCNRLCTRVFRCPGLVWDRRIGKARIDDAICVGCGVCTSICPGGAIVREGE